MSDQNNHEKRPKVSVLMITYNHEKFIEQAVRSVMMQETDFDYELIIGEDCSTDGTREILLELDKKFPGRLTLVLQPENVGIIPNFIATFDKARGEYIAFLEGDDFWTSPQKLQIQLDYMDVHPECLLCFHEHSVIYENSPESPPKQVPLITNVPNKSDGHASMQFGTFMLRKRNGLPRWFSDLRASGEWPLIIWILMEGGKICPLEGPPMSVYRKHTGGVSSGASSSRGLDKLHDYELVKSQLTEQQIKLFFYQTLHDIHRYLCRAFMIEGNFCKARHHFRYSVWHIKQARGWKDIKKLGKMALQCHLPSLFPPSNS